MRAMDQTPDVIYTEMPDPESDLVPLAIVSYRLVEPPMQSPFYYSSAPAPEWIPPHVCLPECGVYLHRCELCGYEGGPTSMPPNCPGCAYRKEGL